ncbi:MAG: CYTH domain-containing protein [Candidatus Dormibacteria bacterium]
MAVEREIKLSVVDTFELPSLEGIANVHAADRGVQQLDATYWDTASLQLMHTGHGLRFRTANGMDGRWTLKGASRVEVDALVREEVEAAGAPERLPSEIAERVKTIVEPDELRPVARLQTSRHIVDLSDDAGPVVEVADDTVRVLDGDAEVERFREVEVELLRDDADVHEVVDRLVSAGAATPGASSKYVRALRALGRLP